MAGRQHDSWNHCRIKKLYMFFPHPRAFILLRTIWTAVFSRNKGQNNIWVDHKSCRENKNGPRPGANQGVYYCRCRYNPKHYNYRDMPLKFFRKTIFFAFFNKTCGYYAITARASIGIVICAVGTDKNHYPEWTKNPVYRIKCSPAKLPKWKWKSR